METDRNKRPSAILIVNGTVDKDMNTVLYVYAVTVRSIWNTQVQHEFAGPTAQGVLDPVQGLLLCRSLTFVLPQGPQTPVRCRLGPCWSVLDRPNDGRLKMGPPLDPKKKLIGCLGPPPVRLLCA